MKINVNRLCQLAGLPEEKSGVLSEASNRSLGEDPSLSDEAEYRFGSNQLAEGESDLDEEEVEESAEVEEEADEGQILEIDEVELVQELRRAKAMVAEAKHQKALTAKNSGNKINESELKSIIESEIANVMNDLNLQAGWVYGNKKPTASKKGYTHQGSFLKGIGFE